MSKAFLKFKKLGSLVKWILLLFFEWALKLLVTIQTVFVIINGYFVLDVTLKNVLKVIFFLIFLEESRVIMDYFFPMIVHPALFYDGSSSVECVDVFLGEVAEC